MNNIPSIFNDIIGPVMRGPSSSHTAASWRIARTCIDILNEPLRKAIIDFDKDGIWAQNYREQGTVMGINGGLLGIEMTDKLMKNTEIVAEEMKITITYEVNSFSTKHANTVRLFLEGINGETILVVAVSLGGGSFEIQQINGFDVKICGDYFELLVQNEMKDGLFDDLKRIIPDSISLSQSSGKNGNIINLKSPNKIEDDIINHFNDDRDFGKVITINPVLPIISGNATEMPFTTIGSLLDYAMKENSDLGELGIIYEKCKSGLSETELLNKMKNIVRIIESSIKSGLAVTTYEVRILHQ